MQNEKALSLSINGSKINVSWENNRSVKALLSHTQNEKITVKASLYGGFEQVGRLPKAFPQNDIQMTTSPGDIVLYSGNQIVIFFGSNTWSYTKLGHIDMPARELEKLLNTDSVVFEISGV